MLEHTAINEECIVMTETIATIDDTELETAQGGVRINMNQLSPAERYIIQHESGGQTTAKNPHSTAFGLGQLLISNRRHYLGANAGTTDPTLQLKAFRSYVHDRYGNANRAEAFWKSHHWY
jgi:hypothetical protein